MVLSSILSYCINDELNKKTRGFYVILVIVVPVIFIYLMKQNIVITKLTN